MTTVDAQELRDLIKAHGWDELIFGGYICTTCTPEDADEPEQNVDWPCQPLMAAGMTYPHAEALIREHGAKIELKAAREHLERLTAENAEHLRTIRAMQDAREKDMAHFAGPELFQLADRPDPETGEPLPAGVEGVSLGHRGEVTRCAATHPNHGQCWNVPGHDGKHFVAADDEYDEYDIEWTDEQAAAAFRELENPTPKCLCGEVFDTQEALDAHVAAEFADEPSTEEPVRTLTAVEDDAAKRYIAPFGAEEVPVDVEARIAQALEHIAAARPVVWPAAGVDDPNDEITGGAR